jgi:hypothetical protein
VRRSRPGSYRTRCRDSLLKLNAGDERRGADLTQIDPATLPRMHRRLEEVSSRLPGKGDTPATRGPPVCVAQERGSSRSSDAELTSGPATGPERMSFARPCHDGEGRERRFLSAAPGTVGGASRGPVRRERLPVATPRASNHIRDYPVGVGCQTLARPRLTLGRMFHVKPEGSRPPGGPCSLTRDLAIIGPDPVGRGPRGQARRLDRVSLVFGTSTNPTVNGSPDGRPYGSPTASRPCPLRRRRHPGRVSRPQVTSASLLPLVSYGTSASIE